MELVSHSVHWFKASLLWNQIVSRFRAVASEETKDRNVFLAGFGNSAMDMKAYHMVGMDLDQIYWIDRKSRISCLDGQTTVEDVYRQQQNHHHELQERHSTKPSLLVEGLGTKSATTTKEDTFRERIMGATELRQPLEKQDYKFHRGTRFDGYQDESLVTHVLRK